MYALERMMFDMVTFERDGAWEELGQVGKNAGEPVSGAALEKQVVCAFVDHDEQRVIGKSAENVRQHLKNGRDILKLDPEIASLAPEKPPDRVVPAPRDGRSTSATPEPKKEEVQ